MKIDVASLKKGWKSERFWLRARKMEKSGGHGEVEHIGDRCQTYHMICISSGMMFWCVDWNISTWSHSRRENLVSWGSTFSVLCYDKCYIHAVKTKVNLIYALSAQTLSHPQSIAIWPATAQLHHTASLWHGGQPGFHETHPKLSIDCKSYQETSDNCDRNC
jgi:hypothetical protein